MIDDNLADGRTVKSSSNAGCGSSNTSTGASAYTQPYEQMYPNWASIDWKKIQLLVDKLRSRITVAAEKKQHRKVRDLQRLLCKSFAARALAVRKVSIDNGGKKTPGVDGVLWTTPEQRYQAILDLADTKRKAKPLRRVEIPKSNGKMRSLGIPTMRDRAHQLLWKLALEPVQEASSDRYSYGFRVGRGAHDAYAQIHACLHRKDAAQWVLDADIKGFFDNLSHDWLLEHIPMCKRTLKSWLKAGFIAHGSVFDTETGTPQGGVISPTLANIALDGLEKHIATEFRRGGGKRINKTTGLAYRSNFRTQLNVIRYADDFIVTGRSRRQLERVKASIQEFLAIRGLELSEEKTSIRNINDEGFDFLGWHFRKYNGTLLGRVSRKSFRNHKSALRKVIKNAGNMSALDLISVLNPKINGWMRYHHICANIWDVWGELNQWLDRQLWVWARKRHRAKGRYWIRERYWKRRENRWRFVAANPKRHSEARLRTYDLGQMKQIVRIPADTNVFMLRNQETINKIILRKRQMSSGIMFGSLLAKQKGKCGECGLPLLLEDAIETHHINPVAVMKEGAYNGGNLLLLHKHCHQKQPAHKTARKRKTLRVSQGGDAKTSNEVMSYLDGSSS